jgi:hypothetical protein
MPAALSPKPSVSLVLPASPMAPMATGTAGSAIVPAAGVKPLPTASPARQQPQQVVTAAAGEGRAARQDEYNYIK